MARKSQKTEAPATNVFGAAPIVVAPVSVAKGKPVEIPFAGVEDVSILVATKKAIEGYLVAAEAKLKADMDEHFIAEGIKIQRQPENFRGEEGLGSASLQMRRSSVALTEETIADFKERGIEMDVQTIVVETFIISPAYANDPIFVKNLEKALGAKLTEMADERGPIIQKQQGVTKTTISEQGLNSIFKESEAVIRELLPRASTYAVLAKLKNGDLRSALDLVMKRFFPTAEEKAKAEMDRIQAEAAKNQAA